MLDMHEHPSSHPPFTISIMLACYVSPQNIGDHALGEWNSPAGIKSRRWLQEMGLIDEDNRSTDKGRAWVKHICATSLPISAWVLPERDDAGDVVFHPVDDKVFLEGCHG
jgi:hypothetical protein